MGGSTARGVRQNARLASSSSKLILVALCLLFGVSSVCGQLTFSASTGIHTGTWNGYSLPSVVGPAAAGVLGRGWGLGLYKLME
jgi:hypothetical protein